MIRSLNGAKGQFPMDHDRQFHILHPGSQAPRRAYVDFVFGLDYLSVNSTLLRLMHQAMSSYGLSCLLINQSNIKQTIDAVRKGNLAPLVYLDLCSKPGSTFLTLLLAMARTRVHTL